MKKNRGVTPKNFAEILRGFTLIELIIVIITLGIIVSLAVPLYTNAVERERGNACINNIRVILAAEKIFYLKNRRYNPNIGNTIDGINNINTQLNISIQGGNFTYFIENEVTLEGNLIIRGTRLGGPYPDSTIEGRYNTGSKTFSFNGSWFADIPPDPPSFTIPPE